MNIKNIIKDKIKIFNGNFITFWARPIKADKVETNSYIKVSSKIGIVIQGGIWDKHSFTFETIKLYKKLYQNVTIIVSTWEDTPQSTIELLKKLDVEIVLNEKPLFIPGNGNLQIISSYAGIKKAKELGCEYVCKTRTDQRMYATDVFSYLLKMLKKFPLEHPVKANERIVALGSNTFRNRLYDINDMWLFGQIDDMLKYWSCSPSMDWPNECDNVEKLTESYICMSYLKQISHNIKMTVEDSIYCYTSYYIIVDIQSIDLYFVKRNKEYFNKSYDCISNIEFSFRDWMSLQ